MSTSESTLQPVHVAFVWHMHQPYYRSARTGAFQMPWARLHALKDYLDMVEILADYPTIHQTFNLVPSLVEQLEDYAAAGQTGSAPDGTTGTGSAADVYWEHTEKPAADLSPAERAFVVERMCEPSDHPRAKSHPRYLELALKRESAACRGWDQCSEEFSVDELRDLQIWFTLSWFDPTLLETEPLLSLVQRGRDFREEDKSALAQVQSDILGRVIPAYRDAAERGQIELSTSPYFHPILPLLINSDSARVGAGDTILPRRRFAHAEDAWEQVARAMAKHQQVFGSRPRGMWCSEQAVGEEVLPLLWRAGIHWTIADQTVLTRSVAGSAAWPAGTPPLNHKGACAVPRTAGSTVAGPAGPSPYLPYLMRREDGEIAIVFRDHTLSDLIGFAYQSWDSRDAANDLVRRIRAIGASFAAGRATSTAGEGPSGAVPSSGRGDPVTQTIVPLVTIALDGENAWEYYPHDGKDFLRYLYDGLTADPDIRCVAVSEHLEEHAAVASLDWLHTGSWIGGDLRTWSGDPGHNAAWDLLHDARDLTAGRRARRSRVTSQSPDCEAGASRDDGMDSTAAAPPGADGDAAESAWHHIMITEGSDWYWWFGEHQHTDLDHAWDLEFRQHLQKVYSLLGEPVPARLYLPVLAPPAATCQTLPMRAMQPLIDGRLTHEDGWDNAGSLLPDHPSTMQRAGGTHIVEVRFGWGPAQLFLLLVPRDPSDLEELEFELTLAAADGTEWVLKMALASEGRVGVTGREPERTPETISAAWADVVEVAIPLADSASTADDRLGIVVRVGRGGMTDRVFTPQVWPGEEQRIMKSPQIITFLTDFGLDGGYVAACEATIAGVCPSARVMHISHQVPAGDVAAGALVLARVASLYPKAVHLAVVDPGVGTARRPVLLSTARGDFLVGPDNGLLLDAAESLGGVAEGWDLDVRLVRGEAALPLDRVSTTFHGRDLFAPASALIASGTGPGALGSPLEIPSLVRLPAVAPQIGDDGSICAVVVEVDRFGNVALGWDPVHVFPGDGSGAEFLVGMAGDDRLEWTATAVRTYADLRSGQLGLIRDSWGQAALALNGASAAELLGAGRGMTVMLTPTPVGGLTSLSNTDTPGARDDRPGMGEHRQPARGEGQAAGRDGPPAGQDRRPTEDHPSVGWPSGNQPLGRHTAGEPEE